MCTVDHKYHAPVNVAGAAEPRGHYMAAAGYPKLGPVGVGVALPVHDHGVRYAAPAHEPKRRAPAPPALALGDMTPTVLVGEMTEEMLVTALSSTLESMASRNNPVAKLPNYDETESVFFSVTKPEIATRLYVKRLVKYAQCSPSAFVVLLVYLERLQAVNSKLMITAFNMHRLLITALMLAAKMLDDRCFSNAHYARVGGIASVREMNRLEMKMLVMLDYKLNVRKEVYASHLRSIEALCVPTSPTSVISSAFSPVPHLSESQMYGSSAVPNAEHVHPLTHMSQARSYSDHHVPHAAPTAKRIRNAPLPGGADIRTHHHVVQQPLLQRHATYPSHHQAVVSVTPTLPIMPHHSQPYTPVAPRHHQAYPVYYQAHQVHPAARTYSSHPQQVRTSHVQSRVCWTET